MSHVLRLIPAAILSLLVVIVQAAAQTYPDRVVRIVNPYPPGGSVDITARILAQKLSDNTGQQFIVENRTGAGGNTGADSVAKSAPDGYTLLFTAPPPLVINQTLYTKGLPFDPTKDFVPVGTFAYTPIVLMVHPGTPVNNVQELIAFAKSNPGKLHFGSAGIGTTPHLSGELFKSMAKVEIVHVPYRGTGPAMNDLIGGHIQMFFDLLPASLPQINGGKVRRPGSPWRLRRRRRRRCSPGCARRSARCSPRRISSPAFASSARNRARSPRRTSAPSWTPKRRSGPR